MIERAARCFEHGGKTLLCGQKRQIRSRRCLHSGFWSHGAGNIDLPAWWIFFLQAPASNNAELPRERRALPTDGMATGLPEIFLDFLYPVQTLALIRRLERSTQAHRQETHSVQRRSRSYTSIAADLIARTSQAENDFAEIGMDALSSDKRGERIRRRVNEILDCKDQTGLHDELWQKHQDLLELSQPLSPQELVKMLRTLGISARSTDAERLLALFESIPVDERRAIHYSHAVSAAINVKDLDTAIAIHREARSRIQGAIGTSAILRYTIQHEMWKEAIDTWHIFWHSKLLYFSRQDIWTGIDALPLSELIEKATAAVDFAISATESTDSESATAAREFALELTRRTLRVAGVIFDIPKHQQLIEKIKILGLSSTEMPALALQQYLSVNSREHGHRALQLYRSLRQDTKFSPKERLLQSVLTKLASIHSTSGMFMMIDDWRKYLGKLHHTAYETVMKELARAGQVDAVQDLFKEFVADWGPPRRRGLFNSLLYVHLRRADTEGIVRTFERLQREHGFIPNLRSYNFLIMTFARVGDVDGALDWVTKLKESGIIPDQNTYSTLMSMYGKRGDIDAVQDLLEQSRVEGLKSSKSMIDSLVLANINDEKLEEAEKLVEEALQMDLAGSRTHMWNVLLNAYAMRKNMEKVSQLQKRMQEAGVPFDNLTYAALMTSLTVAKHPKAAHKVMDTVMPRAGLRRTTLHYAIVMGGYLATKEYGRLFTLYKEMLRRNLTPNMSTQNVLLRAAAAVDKDRGKGNEDSAELTRAHQTLAQTLQNLDPAELAPTEPRKFVGPNALDEAFNSTYFEYMIFLHGTEAAFDKVTELYDSYISNAQKFGRQDVEASPPMRMLSALLVAHTRAENHDEVDRCWYLALAKSEELCRKSKAKLAKPGWVLPSRRFIINLPLHHYIKHLGNQSRYGDLINVINDLRQAGYDLHSNNWNTYIQYLARSPDPAHQLLAFDLCERELIHAWPGWQALGHVNSIKPKFRAMTRDMVLMPRKRMPNYRTFVCLTAAYADARSGGETKREKALKAVAPLTLDAVRRMPRIDDWEQNTILRNRADA